MRKIVRFILPILALAAGAGVLIMMIKTKPKVKKKPLDDRGTLVEVIKVASARHSIDVHSHGTVAPEHLQSVSAEVGGRITWLNDDIDVGARFTIKEKVAQVDGRDYYLAIQQQRAAVDSARTALQVEQGRRNIAKKEWKIMGGQKPNAGSLALRDPQMRTARMQIKAARSGLRRSQLLASKTVVRAPFNGIVVTKSVSRRQLVMPGAPLIVLASTDRFLVNVSVPLRRLEWVKVPGINGVKSDGGAAVEVHQQVGDKYVVRMGKVIRMNAQLDPRGRMAQLIIAIDDPLRLSDKPTPIETALKPAQISKLPLLIGAFVKVKITGRPISSAIELSRIGLHNGNQVYVMTADSKLAIRTVSIIWRLENTVLISAGLSHGDQVIVSPLPVPIAGMKLRLPKKSSSKAAPGEAAKGVDGTKTTKVDSSPGTKTSASVGKP